MTAPASGTTASSLITAAATASHRGRRRSPSSTPAGPPAPGRTPSSAAATYRQNLAGSLSPASSDNHATGRRHRRAQSPSNVDLPQPAGPHTTVTPRPIPCASPATNRGRGTKPARGTWNLVATSTSTGRQLDMAFLLEVVIAVNGLASTTITSVQRSAPGRRRDPRSGHRRTGRRRRSARPPGQRSVRAGAPQFRQGTGPARRAPAPRRVAAGTPPEPSQGAQLPIPAAPGGGIH